MAALSDAVKHFKRAEAVYDAYQRSHQRLVETFSTIVNVHSRLEALRDGTAFAAFAAEDEALGRQVYGKQLMVLNGLGDTLLSLACAPLIIWADIRAAESCCDVFQM